MEEDQWVRRLAPNSNKHQRHRASKRLFPQAAAKPRRISPPHKPDRKTAPERFSGPGWLCYVSSTGRNPKPEFGRGVTHKAVSMIRRILLENYMSHARTEIEPARGLTVLIGPNNCGKSAVVSALQTLCSNIAGDFMVRHGEKECRVTIETDDGHIVTWRRNRGAVSYVIDGREVPRGVTPDDLHDVLRLPKVVSEDGKDQFDIHFGTQKSPIFLLDESERRAAMFFASSSDAEYLMRMQKRHQEKVRDAKRDRDKLTVHLTKLDAELRCLEPVSGLADAMQVVVEEHTAVERQQQLCSRLAHDVEQLARQNFVLTRQASELECLSRLNAPPQLAATEPLQELITQWQTAALQQQMEANRAGVLSELTVPPTLPDIEPLERTLRQLTDATQTLDIEQKRATATEPLAVPPILVDTDTLQNVVGSLAAVKRQAESLGQHVECLLPLRPVPELADVTPLEQVVSELSAASDTVERTARNHDLLATLAAPPVPHETEALSQLIAGCDTANAELASCESDLARLHQEVQSVLDAVREWTAANPVCPACGATVDAERLMTWGHAHG